MNRSLCCMAMLIWGAIAVDSSADIVLREVELTTDGSQISTGGFGAGFFWRPTFSLEPFTLDVGDTLDVTVHLDRPVVVVAGPVDLETASVYATSPNNQRLISSLNIDLDFLSVTGDLLANDLTGTSSVEGGIGGSIHANLTDTWFSFQGFHYSISITEGTGFPELFDTGVIAVQTQGAIQFTAVPESGPFAPWALLVVVFVGTTLHRSRPLSSRR